MTFITDADVIKALDEALGGHDIHEDTDAIEALERAWRESLMWVPARDTNQSAMGLFAREGGLVWIVYLVQIRGIFVCERDQGFGQRYGSERKQLLAKLLQCRRQRASLSVNAYFSSPVSSESLPSTPLASPVCCPPCAPGLQ